MGKHISSHRSHYVVFSKSPGPRLVGSLESSTAYAFGRNSLRPLADVPWCSLEATVIYIYLYLGLGYVFGNNMTYYTRG